ncbi:molybdopterin oxidoreductase family protein, partial [Gordonia aichiensis]
MASDRRDELEGVDTTEQRIDLMLKLGPYGAWNGGELSLRTLLDNPHGLDLGPLRPRLPGVLRTASGHVDLAPRQLLDDVPRLRAGLTARAPEMVLIGRRHHRVRSTSPATPMSPRCDARARPPSHSPPPPK